jgi:hypothetical protein
MTAPVQNARNARPGAEASARLAAGRFTDALRAARRRAAGEGGRGKTTSEDRRPAATVTRKAAQAAAAEKEAERGAAGLTADQQLASQVAAEAPVAALRGAVRALPASIEAARLQDGASLSLSCGSALGVDLRSGLHGLELTLRPSAALGQAAATELPGLVAALRARGLRVARAEVRADRHPSGGSNAPFQRTR